MGPLPFTQDEFFGVFAEYNRGFWWAAAVLWLLSLTGLVAVWRDPARVSRALSLFLGVLWLWNAAAYHALFFTRVNPVAWGFAALFAAQALLFFRAWRRGQIEYVSPGTRGPTRTVGLGFAAYALAYPFLTMASGHAYPATPTYGVPCPTAILTIGLLLTVRGRVPIGLTIIPAIWGFIGGSAAALLAVTTDYVLLGAAALVTLVVIAQRIRRIDKPIRPASETRPPATDATRAPSA